ncbi:PREDICTED: uncharacterized protein LOC108565796 [Nicrophorus vespilloides]|uniref:Uncharacterized protein LOC108565796 n=1 Tax=Nicrophorus vespilloides TaxID=110193 RepID=A0ABM1N253_NICVS|nr:PREDICTED: uncharacterized protein LOC108565796 [Nicrophorus vespilloides]
MLRFLAPLQETYLRTISYFTFAVPFNSLHLIPALNLFLFYLQIYTDWANHYLEKARSKKRVSSLATDCSDGVLLAEVIESVTCQKIPDINRKPKTPTQMMWTINMCLNASPITTICSAQHAARRRCCKSEAVELWLLTLTTRPPLV